MTPEPAAHTDRPRGMSAPTGPFTLPHGVLAFAMMAGEAHPMTVEVFIGTAAGAVRRAATLTESRRQDSDALYSREYVAVTPVPHDLHADEIVTVDRGHYVAPADMPHA